MKITFIEDYGDFKAGQEVDLPAEEASRIMNTGYASLVDVTEQTASKATPKKPAAGKSTGKGKGKGK